MNFTSLRERPILLLLAPFIYDSCDKSHNFGIGPLGGYCGQIYLCQVAVNTVGQVFLPPIANTLLHLVFVICLTSKPFINN